MRTVAVSVVLSATFLPGCGDFEWFPDNYTTVSAPLVAPAVVKNSIAFPSAVKWASDIAYDRATDSFWLLGGTTGTPANAPGVIVRVTRDGAVAETISQQVGFEWPFEITGTSTIVFNGTFFWIASNGYSGISPVSKVFQISASGAYLGIAYNCPATSTGFCQGLAWDSKTSSFWSAASDSSKVSSYQVSDSVVTPLLSYAGPWNGSGVTDVSIDSASKDLFVINEGVIRIKANGSSVFSNSYLSVPSGTTRGDWDGQYFWVVDNNSKAIKALFVR